MYVGRTQLGTKSVLVASLVATFSLLTQAAFAQSTGRLSSDPHDLRDAFARHSNSVNTPQAFSKFVQQNDQLRERYARHFGISQDQVVSFFHDSLVPYTLRNSQTLTTYGVTRSGEIYPVKTTLPKGSRVWATREGTPVLKWNCSNPLVASLPGSTLTPPLEVATTASPILPEGNTPLPAVPDIFGTTGTSELPDPAVASITPIEPDANFAFAVPTADASSASLPGIGEIVDAAGPSINDLWPALFVPVLLSVGGSSGGGGGEAPPFVVVPETNTFALIGAGLPLLAGAGLLARRRKTT